MGHDADGSRALLRARSGRAGPARRQAPPRRRGREVRQRRGARRRPGEDRRRARVEPAGLPGAADLAPRLRRAGVVGGLASNVLVQLAVSMRAHGRGGLLLVVPAGERPAGASRSSSRSPTGSTPPFTRAGRPDAAAAAPTARPASGRTRVDRAVDAIAGLTAVDGATIMTDRLRTAGVRREDRAPARRPPVERVTRDRADRGQRRRGRGTRRSWAARGTCPPRSSSTTSTTRSPSSPRRTAASPSSPGRRARTWFTRTGSTRCCSDRPRLAAGDPAPGYFGPSACRAAGRPQRGATADVCYRNTWPLRRSTAQHPGVPVIEDCSFRSLRPRFVLAFVGAGCSRQPARRVLPPAACRQAAPARRAGRRAAAAQQGVETVSGEVLETMDASTLHLLARQDRQGRHLGRDRQDAGEGGREVTVPLESEMRDFHSPSLNRDFPLIYFVTQISRDGQARCRRRWPSGTGWAARRPRPRPRP